MTWTRDPSANLFTFKFVSGWRACYFSSVLPNGRCAQVGDTVDVGSVFFFNSLNGLITNPTSSILPAGTSSGQICDYNFQDTSFNTCPHSFGQVPVALHALVKAEQLQLGAGTNGDAWFVGTWTSVPIDINNVLGSKQKLNLPFLMMFMECCRISTLLDNNNDVNAFVGTIVTAGSLSSPVTTSRVREYAIVNLPINYFVPGLSPDKHPLSYSFSPTSGGLNSQLNNPFPSKTQSQVSMSAGSIDPVTGRFTWTPNKLWQDSKQTVPALYAVQFKITDTVTQSAIVLDIVFQITDGKTSPFFIDPSPPYDFTPSTGVRQFPGWKFVVGFPARIINIKAQDNVKNKNTQYGIATMDSTVTQLTNFVWTGINPAITQVNGVATGAFTYAVPSLDLPDTTVCFTCRNKLGYPNVAQYCVTLMTVPPIPTTPAPTTVAPTTAAPSTLAPTTEAPTTELPTTGRPTTEVPTPTDLPTTSTPTTITPTPTTDMPTTPAPTTDEPTTKTPTTEAPTTSTPTTAQPTTDVPTTPAPTTDIPTTESPTTEAPTTATPTTDSPTTTEPTTASHTTSTPTAEPEFSTEAPTTETPTTESPTTDTPTETPTTESPTPAPVPPTPTPASGPCNSGCLSQHFGCVSQCLQSSAGAGAITGILSSPCQEACATLYNQCAIQACQGTCPGANPTPTPTPTTADPDLDPAQPSESRQAQATPRRQHRLNRLLDI